jgi:hypothetical protein
MGFVADRGERVVVLYIPVQDPLTGKQVAEVRLKAFTAEMAERWEDGYIHGPRKLMEELTGLPRETLGKITYPDWDRVQTEFLLHIPQFIKEMILEGRIPEPRTPMAQDQPPPMPAVDGPRGPVQPSEYFEPDDGGGDEQHPFGVDMSEPRRGRN